MRYFSTVQKITMSYCNMLWRIQFYVVSKWTRIWSGVPAMDITAWRLFFNLCFFDIFVLFICSNYLAGKDVFLLRVNNICGLQQKKWWQKMTKKWHQKNHQKKSPKNVSSFFSSFFSAFIIFSLHLFLAICRHNF